MKKIIIISNFLFIFLLNTNNLKAVNCFDKYSMACQNWGQWNYTSMLVILADFPGCSLFVNYSFRVCSSNSALVQIYVLDITIGAGCASVTQFLKPNGFVDASRVRRLKQKAFRHITETLFEPEKHNYICPNSKKTYSFWEGTCQKVCELVYSDGTIGYVTKDCETDYCCGIERQYCWNQNTSQVDKVENHYSEQYEECHILMAPLCPQPGSWVGDRLVSSISSESGCTNNCVFD